MVKKFNEALLTAWIFLIGIVLSVVTGFYASFFGNDEINPLILVFLVLLGLIAGYFVSLKNSKVFFMTSVSLVLASFAGIRGLVLSADILGVNIISIITNLLGGMLFFFIPATVVVSLKIVFKISNN